MNGWSGAWELIAIRVRKWSLYTGFFILWASHTSFDKINIEQSPPVHGSFKHDTSNLEDKKLAVPTATLVNVEDFKVLCTWALVPGHGIAPQALWSRLGCLIGHPTKLYMVNRNQITGDYLYCRYQIFRLMGKYFSRALMSCHLM